MTERASSDAEPEEILLSGERVNAALYEWITNLVRTGHAIDVSEDGHVSIVPAVHET